MKQSQVACIGGELLRILEELFLINDHRSVSDENVCDILQRKFRVVLHSPESAVLVGYLSRLNITEELAREICTAGISGIFA